MLPQLANGSQSVISGKAGLDKPIFLQVHRPNYSMIENPIADRSQSSRRYDRGASIEMESRERSDYKAM